MASIVKNLAKLVKVYSDDVGKGDNKQKKHFVKYTSPLMDDTKKEKDMGVIASRIGEEGIPKDLVKKLKALKAKGAGYEFCIHQRQNDKGFWELVDVTKADDAPKEKKGSDWKGKKKSYSSYDNEGNAVGGAWKDALKFFDLTEAKKIDIKDVAELAWEIVLLKEDQVTRLKAHKQGKASSNTADSKDDDLNDDDDDLNDADSEPEDNLDDDDELNDVDI